MFEYTIPRLIDSLLQLVKSLFQLSYYYNSLAHYSNSVDNMKFKKGLNKIEHLLGICCSKYSILNSA